MLGVEAENPSVFCNWLRREYCLETVILTCGTSGSHVYYDGGESVLPTPKVVVADTVGAGDSFTAGFCAALLSGKSMLDAHRIAVELSAYVCTQSGAMPLIPPTITAMIE